MCSEFTLQKGLPWLQTAVPSESQMELNLGHSKDRLAKNPFKLGRGYKQIESVWGDAGPANGTRSADYGFYRFTLA